MALTLDLFAGAGGWSQGLRDAGYTGPAVGIDFDLAACRTAKAAGHDRICADVAGYPVEPFIGRVEGFCASPPCPSFSAAGKGGGKRDMPLVIERIRCFALGETLPERQWADGRSLLTAEPMRWATALRPRWIALEQVPAVLPLWQYTAQLLRVQGYSIWCGILSSECYGVPQTRKRAILMASLDYPVGPPEPTHGRWRKGVAPEADGLFGPQVAPMSMAQALEWDNSHAERTLRSNYGTGGNPQARGERISDDPASTVTGKAGRNKWIMSNSPLANAASRDALGAAGTIFGQRSGNMTWMLAPAGATSEMVDPRNAAVRVSVREAGIFQSFPADYPWCGTKSQQYQQVGNAVPVRLAEAVLRALIA